MNGIIKEYDKQRGFGFITGDDGEDYFVHAYGQDQNLNHQVLDQASELRLMWILI